MNNNFIITTTNIIDGRPIEKYIDTICTNIVIGANIFSDIAASFTDFFGGYSNSYKNKLESIYKEAIKDLKTKAVNIGANAIIGLNIDFDEISGSGKSMFMISVSGTACYISKILENNSSKNDITNNSSNIVSHKALDTEVRRRFIINNIKGGCHIKPEWMDFLYEYPQKEIAKNIIDLYETQQDSQAIRFIERYLPLILTNEILDYIYSQYSTQSITASLIINCNLFSPTHILEIAKENIHYAIPLFNAIKEYYTKDDLTIMKQISDLIDSLPNRGKIEKQKSLFKEKDVFICKYNHESDIISSDNNNIVCGVCGVNIKGLTKDELSMIESFKERVKALEDLLS